MSEKQQKKLTVLEVTFSKEKTMRYISHLDVMRLMMRALRRAKIPFYLTKGFHPHAKIIFKRALKLGEISYDEQAQIPLQRFMAPGRFVKKMNKQFPDGIKIEKAELLR